MHYAKMNVVVRFAIGFSLTVVAVGFPVELNGDLAANIQDDSERQKEAVDYLLQFGYISKSSTGPSSVMASPEEETIKEFQKMAGLTQTGKLDEDTMTMIRTPRCGMKDKEEEEGSRKRRYVLTGKKWSKTSLSYKITVYPESPSRGAVDREIARAFQAWSAVTSMEFTRKSFGTTDILIQFKNGEHGPHGNGHRFKGRGGAVAHAWFPKTPYPGLVCYDTAEQWTIDTDRGQNLFAVAVHEFGHTLGLRHSEDKGAVMWPWVLPYNPDYELGTDDIAGIQELYVTLVKSSDADMVNKEVFPGRDFPGDRHGKVGIILIDHKDGWVVVWWRDTGRREDHRVGADGKYELAYTGALKQCTAEIPCPIMGHMTPWSPWSPFSARCGLARRSRHRQCNYDTLPNARICGEILTSDMEQEVHHRECPS